MAALLSLAVPAVAQSLPGPSDEAPLLVTYGPRAPTREGDPNHAQVIYVSIPLDRQLPVYLRLLDPDTAGAFDTAIGARRDSATRFSIYGGEGAFVPPERHGDDPASGGTLHISREFGPDRRVDGQWLVLAELMPGDGQMVQDRAVFRIEIEGTRGDDGNIYDLFASATRDRNLSAHNVELFTYAPTVRVPDDDRLTEIRFIVPAHAEALTVHNFDAAGAEVEFVTPFRSVPLDSSGQDAWSSTAVPLEPADIGRLAAVTVRRGEEIPNDFTIYVDSGGDGLVPLELPAHRWAANTRPTARLEHAPASCASVDFRLTDVADADGDDLSILWYFQDDLILSGEEVRYAFPEPGTYPARAELLDDSGLVANGWARDFSFTVKAPPVAVAQAPDIVALGTPVRFDGTGSHSPGHEISGYLWSFGDGRRARDAFVDHAFDTPGLHTVRLAVRDLEDHPCNEDEVEFQVRVNARPVPDAGPDRHVAVGEAISFDLGASRDPDGEGGTPRWSFGDGTVAEGAEVSHAYAAPGEYQVALTIDDGTGVTNSVGLDVMRVRVNAAPVAEAVVAATAAIGETVEFDATASHDPDGSIARYDWDFGDGTSKTGARVSHTYRAEGSFRVVLRVTDDSGRGNQSTETETEIVVTTDGNAAPMAEAGEDRAVVVGGIISFDGSGSHDPDGNIVEYEWDFGDSGTVVRGITARYTYLRTGEYQVRLTVRDDSGKPNDAHADTLTVRVVAAPNAGPVAEAGADVFAAIGEVITFDGSASYDPDGNVLDYEWDFGDGALGNGIAPIHAYFERGEYQVTLRVREDSASAYVDMDTLVVKISGGD